MQLFYYNGRAFEKMRRLIYVCQGLECGGFSRKRYRKDINVRGYRTPYDPK